MKRNYLPLIPFLLVSLSTGSFLSAQTLSSEKPPARRVDEPTMQKIYDTIKTPFKYGVILKGEKGKKVDCPSVFRHRDKWYMMYIIFDGSGYETALAESVDLLEWKPLGKILRFSQNTWDANQTAGFIALQDYTWGGSYTLGTFQEKYWLSYLGGALKGYETDPLSIGMAWTEEPFLPVPWQRWKNNPVLSPSDPKARPFENKTLYKSHIIEDAKRSLGHRFVMFYNAKQQGKHVEAIGLAVSDDMVRWKRYGTEPLITAGKGITGDPQITKIGDVWIMF